MRLSSLFFDSRSDGDAGTSRVSTFLLMIVPAGPLVCLNTCGFGAQYIHRQYVARSGKGVSSEVRALSGKPYSSEKAVSSRYFRDQGEAPCS